MSILSLIYYAVFGRRGGVRSALRFCRVLREALPQPNSSTMGVLATAFVVAVVVRRHFATLLRVYVTRAIHLLRIPPNFPTATYRQVFNDTIMVRNPLLHNHTHATAAANRNTATTLLTQVANNLGMKPFFYQCSATNLRNGEVGSRTYWWVKDVVIAPHDYVKNANELLCLVDVDYYIDLPSLLVNHGGPVALYTMIPEAVACSQEDIAFTFDRDSNIVHRVSGGATYSHKLWNFGVDAVTVSESRYVMFCHSAAFMVEKRRIADHRYVLLFVPIGRWNTVGTWLNWFFLETSLLVRLKVAQGDFLRLLVMSSSGLKASMARVGEYMHCTIPIEKDNTIAGLARISKTDLSVAQVGGLIDDRAEAVVAVDYHRHHSPSPADTTYPVSEGVRRYQILNGPLDADAKPSMIPFMAPIIHGCFAPDRTLNNDIAAVEERVVKLASSIELTPLVLKCIVEFLVLLIPREHTLHPSGQDEVFARQNRPAQRVILETAAASVPLMEALRKLKTFMKSEAYAEIKAPRIISTINGVDKLGYSEFTYTLADAVGECSWYAFSKTPKQVAARVAAVATNAGTLTNTDLSRFDGRVSAVLRELEQRVLLRAFAPQYHARLLELHGSQYDLPAVSTFGVRYESGKARASGSPETSLFNTIDNAFINFLALRTTRFNGVFLRPEEAWRRLGVYGGDDGLTADIAPIALVNAAASVGQVLTAEPVKRGELGVKFLARIYSPAVWYGDVNSCCDLPRQLSKFHATHSLPPDITPETKLVAKAMSFVLSDRRTPVIGYLCESVLKCFKRQDVGYTHAMLKKHKADLDIGPWLNAQVAENEQYPNENTYGWMVEYARKALPGFDFMRFDTWIGKVNEAGQFATLDMYLHPPLCMDVKTAESKLPVAVDGEILGKARNNQRSADLRPPNLEKDVDTKSIREGKPTVKTRQNGKTHVKPDERPAKIPRGPKHVGDAAPGAHAGALPPASAAGRGSGKPTKRTAAWQAKAK